MARIEPYLPAIFLIGLALMAAGALWLVVLGFRRRVWWGLGMLAFPPSAAAFAWNYRRAAAAPLGLMLLGAAMAAGPQLTRLLPVDLGPLERRVDGEVHLTLTGWDRDDYSILRSRPETVVLQMANPDVDDRTLDSLRGMSRLRELDLNGTKITDAGLEILAGFATLESLKVRDTAITDAGFRRWLAGMESLKLLDLRGTAVEPETVGLWKAAKPGRRALR